MYTDKLIGKLFIRKCFLKDQNNRVLLNFFSFLSWYIKRFPPCFDLCNIIFFFICTLQFLRSSFHSLSKISGGCRETWRLVSLVLINSRWHESLYKLTWIICILSIGHVSFGSFYKWLSSLVWNFSFSPIQIKGETIHLRTVSRLSYDQVTSKNRKKSEKKRGQMV